MMTSQDSKEAILKRVALHREREALAKATQALWEKDIAIVRAVRVNRVAYFVFGGLVGYVAGFLL